MGGVAVREVLPGIEAEEPQRRRAQSPDLTVTRKRERDYDDELLEKSRKSHKHKQSKRRKGDKKHKKHKREKRSRSDRE
jgi:hypothetical protein